MITKFKIIFNQTADKTDVIVLTIEQSNILPNKIINFMQSKGSKQNNWIDVVIYQMGSRWCI